MGFAPGKRVYAHPGGIVPLLAPGEYYRDVDGRWWVRLPEGSTTVKLATGDVTEHPEDGTISVRQELGAKGFWRGRLERGVWLGEGE